MKTPIADFIGGYQKSGALRMHMPGHKGRVLLGPEAHDITEIEGADVLYSPEGIILESEKCAAELFGTARTVYSTEGSSLAIKAMAALLVTYAKERGEKPLILAARNAHKAFVNAAALLRFDVEWLFADERIFCDVSEEGLKKAISGCPRKPTALYVTSPDYLGNIADVKMLSRVCHGEGILLVVDNAHGAYLKFMPEDAHPMTLGADMCCDSAHKTLPTLTGGAYLHVSKSAPAFFSERADDAMALFASTSPSYLILESLDLTNKYIADKIKTRLKTISKRLSSLKDSVRSHGFTLLGDEELKITLAPREFGYTGVGLAKKLEEKGIFAEFADGDYTVLMISSESTPSELDLLEEALISVLKKTPLVSTMPKMPRTQRVMPIHEALLAPSVLVSVDEAEGKILSSAAVSCPPAVPIVISGERIDGDAVAALKYYGTQTVRVVKE